MRCCLEQLRLRMNVVRCRVIWNHTFTVSTLHDLVSVIRWVIPCKYRKILEMLLKLVKLCEICEMITDEVMRNNNWWSYVKLRNNGGVVGTSPSSHSLSFPSSWCGSSHSSKSTPCTTPFCPRVRSFEPQFLSFLPCLRISYIGYSFSHTCVPPYNYRKMLKMLLKPVKPLVWGY